MNPIGLPAFLYRILGRLTKFNYKIVTLIKDWFQQLRQYPAADSNHTSTTRQLETPGATTNTVWSQALSRHFADSPSAYAKRNVPRLCDPLRTKRRASGRISKYCGGLSNQPLQCVDSNHCLANKKVNPPLLTFGSMIAYRPAKQ